jgi:hypothetical protein
MLRHDRLNSLADINSATTYLEIGVREGATLKKVNIARKYGVDPLFRFDKSSFFDNPNERVELFEMTSDRFFVELSPDIKFDIVFIDGLHHYDQVVRDILGALRHSHSRTIMVVDDTIPTSIASATRNLSDLEKMMQATGETSKNWMGDVYKVFPFIHNFLRQFELATFPRTSTLHPQTVIWQKQGHERKTSSHSFPSPFFETYEDFLMNMEMANVQESEESLFALLKLDLGSK